MEDRFKSVTAEELKAFLAGYPRALTYNVTTTCDPPLANWNDFARAPYWTDSVVASASLPYAPTDAPLSNCRVLSDINAPVADDGTRETDTPLTDRNGRPVKEGDSISVHWGASIGSAGVTANHYRAERVLIRDKGTKYEHWSMESCHNYLRGFDFEVITASDGSEAVQR